MFLSKLEALHCPVIASLNSSEISQVCILTSKSIVHGSPRFLLRRPGVLRTYELNITLKFALPHFDNPLLTQFYLVLNYYSTHKTNFLLNLKDFILVLKFYT